MSLDYKKHINDFSEIVNSNFRYANPLSIEYMLYSWSENKENIYKRLGNKEILSSEPIELGLEGLNQLDNYSTDFSNKMESYFKTIRRSDGEYDVEFSRICYRFFIDAVNTEGFLTNTVMKDWKSPERWFKNSFTIKKGMRFAKSLKFFFGDSDKEKIELKDFQNFYSTFTQKFKSKKKIILNLSINPFDFISISDNDRDWQSCHNIVDGDYRAGNFNYLSDGVTLVAYCLTEDDSFNRKFKAFGDKEWNSKLWRMLVHIKEEDGKLMVCYNKQYPYHSEQFLSETHKLISSLYSEYDLVEYKPMEFFFDKGIRIGKSKDYTLHYEDMYEDNGCNVSYSTSCEDSIKDNPEEYYGFVKIGEPILCLDCGRSIASENLEGLCESCCDISYCNCCDSRQHTDDMVYIEEEGIYVCSYCYEQNYIKCDVCEMDLDLNNVHFNETLEIEECEECAKARRLSEANLYVYIDGSEYLENLSEEKFCNILQEINLNLLKENINDVFFRLIYRNPLYENVEKYEVRTTMFFDTAAKTLKYSFDKEDLGIECFNSSNIDLPKFTKINIVGFGTEEMFEKISSKLKKLNPDALVSIIPKYAIIE